MVANFPGPYELRFHYETKVSGSPATDHTQRLNLDLTVDPTPGDAFNNINAKTRGGISTPDLAAAVEAWNALLEPLFRNDTTFGLVELWKYAPLSFDATFISSYNPTLNAGSSAISTGTAQQDIWTFRTLEGGNMKIVLMQMEEAVYAKIAYPTGTMKLDDIFDFITSNDNWVLARDTSYPFSSIRFLRGQNERLFRVHFR